MAATLPRTRAIPFAQLLGVPVVLTYVVALSIVRWKLPEIAVDSQLLVTNAMAFDLAVGLPVLAYFFLMRPGRAPWIVLVPAVVVGQAAVALIVPAAYQASVAWIRVPAVLAEGVILAYIARRARRALVDAGGGDFATRFRTAARQAIGVRLPADVLTSEASILYYLFARRSAPPHRPFSMHKGYGSVVLGIMIAIVMETVALHLLISLWSVVAAWIVTALSIYAGVWILGDYRAILLRSTRISETHLHLRVGIRWEADIPIEDIFAIETLQPGAMQPPTGALAMPLIGDANVRFGLRTPTQVVGLYGMLREPTEIWVRVDEPEAFVAEVSRTAC